MRINEVLTEDKSSAQSWIEKVYSQYPDWPYGQADKVMVWGEGEEQQFAAFKLKPGKAPDTVEIDWIMAGPEQRKGVGSRAIKELQRQAQEDRIKLTLFPWAKGKISQASLTKLYKRHGFKPVAKGAKPMQWEPSLNESDLQSLANEFMAAYDNSDDTLHAIRQNLRFLIGDLKSVSMWAAEFKDKNPDEDEWILKNILPRLKQLDWPKPFSREMQSVFDDIKSKALRKNTP